jgi:hypothetical protein
MNSLLLYVLQNDMDADETMNLLQEHAVISDNCVTISDVCEVDCKRAVAWLEKRGK